MANIDIIRAWKDARYRRSLTEEQRSQLPENPAGLVELTDADLEVAGGARPPRITTAWFCTLPSFFGQVLCGCK